MGWKSFNDRLALGLVFLIPALWVFSALVKPIDEAANGASIVVWTLVAQYYFRRSPPNGAS